MIIAIVFTPWLVASGLHFLFYKLWDINQNINEWEMHFNPAWVYNPPLQFNTIILNTWSSPRKLRTPPAISCGRKRVSKKTMRAIWRQWKYWMLAAKPTRKYPNHTSVSSLHLPRHQNQHNRHLLGPVTDWLFSRHLTWPSEDHAIDFLPGQLFYRTLCINLGRPLQGILPATA